MKKWSPLQDVAVTLGIVTAFLFLLIPFLNWFAVGEPRWSGILHGAASTLTMLIACFAMHALFYHFRALELALPKLMMRMYVTNVLIVLSIISGNWLYIAYRAPDGAMQWFLMHAPNAHLIMMEFKEFISLFPLPLGVVTSFLLYRFRNDSEGLKQIRNVVAVLIAMMWTCMLVGFVFGLGLAKLRLA